jgi:penicillin amidase
LNKPRIFDASLTMSHFARRLMALLLGRRLPRTSGTLAVPGLHGRVTIARDRWGIPHIEAENDHDAWFALGFCQAQDRAFQLESILRVTRGTLAEMVGPRGLPADRLVRRVGFVRSARRQLPALDRSVIDLATAFAAGIYAGHAHGSRFKPHELAILGGRLTPWTAVDVLAYVKLQSFILPSNWDAELARLQILSADGEQALRDLDPSVRAMSEEFAAFRAAAPAWTASNNWVIAPERTASGRPIVCNDPHLFPALPSQWYLAHLMTPEWAIAGAAFAGTPGFAAAFNGHVAWGTTAGLIDNADLFAEQVQGRRVRQGAEWVDCQVHVETIRVRGRREPVIEEVLETPRGPIITPALGGAGWPALALRATWLDPKPIRGYLDAVRAQNGEELRQCFADWPALPLNLVYADAGGTIGYQMAGHAPRRKHGRGALPKPGWDESYAWDGIIPFDEMPHVERPATGFFATANNPPPGHEQDSPLGEVWMDPYRWQAIGEALSSKTGWTVADCQHLQMDVRSIPWRAVRDVILAAAESRPALSNAAKLLREWKGNLAADSKAAALFSVFAAGMMVQVAQARAPRSYEWFLGKSAWLPGINMYYLKRMGPLVELLREQPAGWFDKPWREIIADGLEMAVKRCAGKTWGELHLVRPKSLLLGDTWPFSLNFRCGPASLGGDTDTISQASVRPLQPIGETDNVAGMRMVVDIGAWSNSRFVLCGGQSGNPLSPHYDDLFELWKRGEGVPMAWTQDEVRQAARRTLTLHATED